MNAPHIVCEPSILYFGTPVVLISSENEDGSANLAPMSSAFQLGWRSILGLNALSKNMAWALAAENILVNTVTPGVVKTEALRHFVAATDTEHRYDPDNLQDVWQWMRATFGSRYAGIIGRIAVADEVTSLLLLLGSRANTYIVGANIPIDGGTDFSAG